MIDDTYCPLCGSVVCPGDCDDRVRPRGPLPRWRDLFEASPAPCDPPHDPERTGGPNDPT